jgi:hypothetical protein
VVRKEELRGLGLCGGRAPEDWAESTRVPNASRDSGPPSGIPRVQPVRPGRSLRRGGAATVADLVLAVGISPGLEEGLDHRADPRPGDPEFVALARRVERRAAPLRAQHRPSVQPERGPRRRIQARARIAVPGPAVA